MTDWVRTTRLDGETTATTTITIPDGADRVCLSVTECERLIFEAGYQPVEEDDD